jgi:AraC family transcriptional regulator, ethanolamine operon transcriptional activator
LRTRIIGVATDWGFWHMGHFARDYRAMFGESPSRTLLK